MAPPHPEAWPHSLPPILRNLSRTSVPSCSEGSWGLSVPLRERCIFTASSISLSPWWRQWGSRYSIRAGRNLPAKEFRYLRTVIVTAAVYRGFGSCLRFRLAVPLTFRHRAGVSSYTSSFELAEACVFGKQSLPPLSCDPFRLPARSSSPKRAHLIPKLRCQFAEFLHQGSLTRLSVFHLPT